MGQTSYRRGLILSIAVMLLALSCKPSPKKDVEPKEPADSAHSTQIVEPAPRAPSEAAEPLENPPLDAHATEAPTKIDLGKPVILGPAGSVVATPEGVLFRLKGDELALAPWTSGSIRRLPKDVAKRAASRAPAPAHAGEHAYFVSEGRLVRRRLDGKGELEVLTSDAIERTRAAASILGDGKAVAAYIAVPEHEDGDRRARLWIEGEGVRDLSPEGSGATSVDLVRKSFHEVVAVSLEGRTAMAPIHARSIEEKDGRLVVGKDVVFAVAPPANHQTEIVVAPSKKGLLALVPLAKNARHFGLMSVLIGSEPRENEDLDWLPYPNGLEPAPVAATTACGEPRIAYARPEAEAPFSPVLVELATLGDDGRPVPEKAIARHQKVRAISMAARKNAMLLVWVADGRTYARIFRC